MGGLVSLHLHPWKVPLATGRYSTGGKLILIFVVGLWLILHNRLNLSIPW